MWDHYPGTFLIPDHCEGAPCRRHADGNMRVDAQALARRVPLKAGAEGEGVSGAEVVVEFRHHQQVPERCRERALKLRKDAAGVHCLRLFLAIPLEGEEAEGLVRDDWAAERAAELLAIAIGLLRLEESARLQAVVAPQNEAAAVDCVRP